MRKTLTIFWGLLLLLMFAQCSKDKENQVNEENIALTDAAMEFIDDNIQSQLDLLSDKEVSEMMESLATWLAGLEGVTSATSYGDSVIINYVDETESYLVIFDMTIQDDTVYDSSFDFPRCESSLMLEKTMIGNHKVFLYDAFSFDDKWREGDTIDKYFSYYDCEIKHLKDEQCTVESLNQLTQYGFVLLATHGARNAFATKEKVTSENRKRYLDDRLLGKLRVYHAVYKIENGYEYTGRYYWATSKFIKDLDGQFNNAIVINSSCDGMKGDTPLKKAFLGKGVASYYGFDDEVRERYKFKNSTLVVRALLRNYTTGEAVDACKEQYPQASYGTHFDMAGSRDITWYDIPPVPADGLVAYYPFNGNADDASGNGNNGILSGGNVPVLTADRKGEANSAYEFGGYYNPNWIKVPNSESLQFDKEFTISFWIQQSELAGMDGWGNYSTTGPVFAPVCKAGDGNACFPGLFFTTGIGENGVGLNVSTTNCNGNSHDHSTWNHNISYNYSKYQLGDWVHVALVVENNNKILCINGLEASWDELGKEADFSFMNQQDLYIGVMAGRNPNFGWGGGFWFPFYGKIDDIRIYNRALDPFEIKALYQE